MGSISRTKRRVLWAFGVLAVAAGAACGLDSGSILAEGAGADGSTGSDGGSIGDGSSNDAAAADDASSSFDGDTLPDGGTVRRIFASTTSAIYGFNVDTHEVTRLLGFAFCGLDGGYDTYDLAVASTRQVYVLPWKTNGQFWLYAVNPDGGCVDVHGGPGTNPGAPDMWTGFQTIGGSDTLLALVQGQRTLYTYDKTGSYLGGDTNMLQSPARKATSRARPRFVTPSFRTTSATMISAPATTAFGLSTTTAVPACRSAP